MRRTLTLILTLALAGGLAPAGAHHELPTEGLEGVGAGLPTLLPGEERSENMSLVANWAGKNAQDAFRQGSDLAFWGSTAVVGTYESPSGFRLLDISRPSRPRQVGQFRCQGDQADVSIWKDLVFVSVDRPMIDSSCKETNNRANAADTTIGTAWEGIRVVSIAKRSRPRQIAAVATDCGSHTHTLVPDLDHRSSRGKARPRLLIYVLSYPLNGQGVNCSAATHRKISVVKVPLHAPHKAKVVSTPDVSPSIGCHDVTVYPKKKIAGAACISESQIWDISDPVNPTIIGRVRNPVVNIHHSTTFNWSADTLVIGDELGGALLTPGCTGGHAPLGALWFYDISDPANPVEKGHFAVPQTEPSLFCTAHNFNTVPLRANKDVLVSTSYNGGTFAVNFTDPSNPRQLGYYVAKEPVQAAGWSSYWYNGFVYTNNFDEDVNSLTARSRGVDVMKLHHPDVRSHAKVKRLNPQTMEPFPGLRR